MTAYERTGWRDKEISNRHRDWGFNCPSVDLDFVMVEYNFGAPVAIVEYKHHLSSVPAPMTHPTMKALGSLYTSTGEQIPLVIAYYWPEAWAFRVKPYNASAERIFGCSDWIDLTEREWVTVLYALRSQYLSDNVLGRLENSRPPGLGAA